MLQSASRALKLNQAENIRASLLPSQRYYGAVSLWYLEPSNNLGNAFDIISYYAPEMPSEVPAIFEKMRDDYHPVQMNEREYYEAKRIFSSSGKLNRKQFLSHPDRRKFVSIAGFVYTKEHYILST